jgi:hypothetical protein
MAEFIQDSLRSQQLRDQPFFDPEKVIALLDSLPRMTAEAQAALDPGLMMLLGTVRMTSLIRSQGRC